MNTTAPPPVRYLVLWLTTACNLSCAYCYRGDQPRRTMSLEVARAALDLAASSGLPFHVQLAGGEPSLEPELMEAIGRTVRGAGWPATLAVQTNGTLIDKHLIDLCRRTSISFGISLDGPPDVHERVRGSAGATFRGLGLLDRAEMPVRVTTVLSAFNIMELGRLILSLASFTNVQGVALDPVILKGNALVPSEHRFPLPGVSVRRKPGSGHDRLGSDFRRNGCPEEPPECNDDEETAHNAILPSKKALRAGVHAMLTMVKEVNRLRSHHIRWRELDSVNSALKGYGKRGGYCHACKGESLAVHPDGTVYPCGQTVGDPAMAAGTVDRVDWGRLRGMFRGLRLSGDCNECPLQNRCPGDCPSRMHYNGRWGSDDAMCLIYRTIIESLERRNQS